VTDLLLYVICGLSAGLLGGYLGLGGGIVIVPFLTVIMGVDIKAAVPVSVSAIVVNSFSASNAYLRKGMVDLELVILLALFMVLGNIAGSSLSRIVPAEFMKVTLALLLTYAAISLLRNRKVEDRISFSENRQKYFLICTLLAFFTGAVSGLVGIGGGIILIPVLYLVIGLPMTTARGTSSLMIGFSSAAAATVYYLNDMIDFKIVTGVILGVIVGGKLGGYLGTVAKPTVVKVLFFFVMLYLAFRLAYAPLKGLL
jgi:hypothetical protein